MGENSKIEWCAHTFNPWIGCTKISPACDNCYAAAWDARWGNSWGPHVRRRTSAANWRKPLAWHKAAAAAGERHRVFCASLADVFDNDRSITSGWRGDLWHLFHRTPNLDWLLLTKRTQNIARYLRPEEYGDLPKWGDGWPNVWLGTTVENQEEADRRIPQLLAMPAAVRFVSAEPLLGPVDLTPHLCPKQWSCDFGAESGGGSARGTIPKLDWVIVGGESGPRARPMHPDWVRGLRDQCQAAGVAFFFKQWGEWGPPKPYPIPAQPGEMTRFTVATSSDSKRVGATVWRVGRGLERQSEFMDRKGKRAAGRMLDGRTWDGMPEVMREGRADA
ncbi:phage Gp37/Gp68 family protein [Rhodovulum sulfidophilum]|uniref:Phage Gp37/Gp68 family protein n=1 Tax=Rhodovulum sulfidophilum TaxID=35806 RepID=A0ABS1RRZ6_RHOSU|nr:phage Gp37/Gp68 family protein [Rhodovulum sulfidophilum]MBL3608667.1 phage Gp37/Gp68 family protein [Rhodovulum sulfidophilum]MCE8456171.1 phage Gp37/Gp68 family protein [Rhodovulum sulfidophilum]